MFKYKDDNNPTWEELYAAFLRLSPQYQIIARRKVREVIDSFSNECQPDNDIDAIIERQNKDGGGIEEIRRRNES